MDTTTLSDISSSMAEFLEKEKIYKDICRSITEGVTAHDNSMSTPQDKFLTPDDEINALLKQMSQILTPDEEADVLGSSEERSVEVILKEAEDLIRSSTPLFLNMSSGSSTKTWPPPQRKLTPPCNVTQTISKADNDHSNSDDSDNQVNDTSNPKVDIKETDDEREKLEIIDSNKDLNTSLSPDKSSSSNYSISEANDQIFKDIINRKKRKTSNNIKSRSNLAKEKPQEQLMLSDLAIPSIEKNSKTNKNLQEEINRLDIKSPQEKWQKEADDSEKKYTIQIEQMKTTFDEKTFDLKKQINILNAKLQEYERSGKDKRTEAEILVTAQQRQIEMLEAELRTQEQLIAGYQRENHKLCQEMNCTKVRQSYFKHYYLNYYN